MQMELMTILCLLRKARIFCIFESYKKAQNTFVLSSKLILILISEFFSVF